MGRFKKVAFFPYAYNEWLELCLLFFMDTRGSAKEVFYDFGWKVNKFEPTVYYSAVRSFMTMTKGIFLQDSFAGAREDICFDEDHLYKWYQEGLESLVYRNKSPLIHWIIDNCLGIFYQLPFYKPRESLNDEIQKLEGMEHYEFNWVPIESFEDQSTKNLVSDLNKRLIIKSMSKLIKLQKDHVSEIERIELCEKTGEEYVKLDISRPHFAILWTDPREVWRYHYPALFIPNLIDENDIWKTYHCFDGEYPNENQLKSLKGVLIPGNVDSPLDDSLPYLVEFKKFIKILYSEYRHIRIVGSWAGHQLITIALGGEVAKWDIDVPLTLGKYKNMITKEMKRMEEFKTTFGKNYEKDHIYIIRSHSYEVTKMPEGGQTLAKCKFGEWDIYKIGDRVLSLQPHPEFTELFLEYHILNRIKPDNLGEIKHNLYEEEIKNQGSQVLEMIRMFLKNKPLDDGDNEENKDQEDE
jgi:GMP synthase-like glutamine amidotransferase